MAQVEGELSQARGQNAAAPNVDAEISPALFDENVVQAAANAAADKSKDKEDPKALSAKWDNGLKLQSKDKNFSVRVGGRTQLDAVFYDNSPAGFQGTGGVGDEDSVDFRRARLRVEGTMYKYYDFCAEYEFLNTVNSNQGLQPPLDSSGNIITVPAVTDLWVRIREVPILGNVRIGNQKTPIGMEHVTSSRYLEFMERSFNQDAFYGPFNNGFQPGIAALDTYAEERGTWSFGFFKNTTNGFGFDTGDGEYESVGRVTFTPIYECEGEYLLHVGMGGSHRDTNDDRLRIRTRGSLRNGAPGPQNPVFADTGTMGASAQNLISPEVAAVVGPWTFVAEYTGSWVNDASPTLAAPPIGTVYFQGYYVEALYFLTGEHRVYDREEARFTRVSPKANGALVRQECARRNGAPAHGKSGAVFEIGSERRRDPRGRRARRHAGSELVREPQHEVPMELRPHLARLRGRPGQRRDRRLRNALGDGFLEVAAHPHRADSVIANRCRDLRVRGESTRFVDSFRTRPNS
ncbi:MAG: porin [Pirellulales bacterium]